MKLQTTWETVDHFNDIDALFSIIGAEDKELIYLGDTIDLTINDTKKSNKVTC